MSAARATPEAVAARGALPATVDRADADRAYAELRHAVITTGLLNRAYGYYAWRSGVSFVLLAIGLGAAFLLPAGPVSITLNSVLLAFGSVQVALVGRYFERVADHAVNVAARVAFMVTGEFRQAEG